MSVAAFSSPGTLADSVWHQRAATIDWQTASEALRQQGNAVLPQLLNTAECAALAQLYGHAQEGTFRSRVVMQRHGFGPRTIGLPRQADGLLRIHLVRGLHPYAEYDVDSGHAIREE